MNSLQKFRITKKGILTNSYSKQKNRKTVEYTLKQLHDIFLTDKRFDRLYVEWVKSGYIKNKKPTIDRIDCKKGYKLGNIQCLTWEENRYKQRMETNVFRAKPIFSYKDGLVIDNFKSVSDAVRKTGLMQGNISACLTKKRKKCGGFNWDYFSNIHSNPELLK